jgi:hypothetical protein
VSPSDPKRGSIVGGSVLILLGLVDHFFVTAVLNAKESAAAETGSRTNWTMDAARDTLDQAGLILMILGTALILITWWKGRQ